MLRELHDIGLGENEAKVYLAMLELGPATVLQIAAKAGINRPTAYVQIESLKKRGLVHTQTKGKRQLFSASSPAQLESMLQRQAKEVEVHQAELAKVLPQLQTMYDLAGNKPVVRYFEGLAGLKDMQEEFLKTKSKQLYGLTSYDAVVAVFPKQFSDYTPRRVAKGIRSRSIYTSAKGPIVPAVDEPNLRESKCVSAAKLQFLADITIFDDSVAISSLAGVLSGTIITHPDVAASFRSLHDFLWELLP